MSHAQIIFQLSSEPPVRPFLIYSYREESIPESPVTDSLDEGLEKPSIAIQEKKGSVNAGVLTYDSTITDLDYRKRDDLAQHISEDDELTVTGEDLPGSLYETSWTGTIPVLLDDDLFAIGGGGRGDVGP